MTPDPTEALGTAEGLYSRMESIRRPFLERARNVSKLTIPYLLPPEGHSRTDYLYSPFQSVGAEGVNNIASKLLLALMQPGAPFFRVAPTPKIEQELDEAGEEEAREELRKAFAEYERIVMHDLEAKGDRVVIFEALKHLIIAGNVLFFQDVKGSRIWHLDRYCVRRDPMGEVIEIVIKEEHTWDSLDADVQAMLPEQAQMKYDIDGTIAVYTRVCRKKNQWLEYQEVQGMRVPGTEAQYPLDLSPYIPLRLVRVSGESYGRGYVEQFYGDLRSLETLSRAIVEGSSAMAKLLFLVRPNGTTNAKTLAKAPNGAIREGNADDVSTLQSNKALDFREVGTRMDVIERRLARAMLLDSVISRDAERVTAEEIRRMAQMLEDALGGVYSTLTQDFQLPFVNRRIAILQRSRDLPRLPKGMTRVTIVTGVEALGRGHDRNRLVNWVTTIAQTLGPQAFLDEVNARIFMERLALSDGVEVEGLLKSLEQKQQEAQMQQQQQMQDMVVPEAAKAMGGMAQQAMTEGVPQ